MIKGFTLIELLVVIAILVVLSVAVVLVLNPAELIKQGRDATRVSDLSALQSAIAFFIADVQNPTWSVTSTCTAGTSGPGGACVTNANTTTTGSGWVNVNFSQLSVGSPLPLYRLPLDPINSLTGGCGGTVSGCFYAYKSGTTAGKFKLYANMESAKYTSVTSTRVEDDDGGTVIDWYEIGSDLSL